MWDIPLIKKKAPEVRGGIKVCYCPMGCVDNKWYERKGTYVAHTSVETLIDAISEYITNTLDAKIKGFDVENPTPAEKNIVLYGKEGVSHKELEKRAKSILKECKGNIVNEFSGGYECCEKVTEGPPVQYFGPSNAYDRSKDNASDTDGPVNFELSDSVIANASDAKRSVDSNASSMDNFNNYNASDMDSSARPGEFYMGSPLHFKNFDSEAGYHSSN